MTLKALYFLAVSWELFGLIAGSIGIQFYRFLFILLAENQISEFIIHRSVLLRIDLL